MARPMQKVAHQGKVWCKVGDAAAYLHTNANKIRGMMGDGRLSYTQIKANGPIYVSVSELMKIQAARAKPDN